MLCDLMLCVTTVDAGDDEAIDDRHCPELQSSYSKSTSTDPDTGQLAHFIVINSSAYRPPSAFKIQEITDVIEHRTLHVYFRLQMTRRL